MLKLIRQNVPQTTRNSTGFTLIELLVALTILSILIYVATPSLSGIIQQQNMETAKNRIIQSLKKAKKIANAENTFVDVSISENTIKLVQKNKTNTLTINIPGQIIAETPVTFTFNSTGTLSQLNGESIETVTNITINPKSNPSLLKTISISNTGIIASL